MRTFSAGCAAATVVRGAVIVCPMGSDASILLRDSPDIYSRQ